MNNNDNSQQLLSLELSYQSIINIWEGFCSEHTKLYDLTSREYSCPIANEMDEIEKIVPLKNTIIHNIKELEDKRKNLIQDINLIINQDEQKIGNVTDLIKFFHAFEELKGANFLFKYNELLIEIISKIQEQNRKNQMYINRMLKSIKEISEGIIGRKKYQTYDASGASKTIFAK